MPDDKRPPTEYRTLTPRSTPAVQHPTAQMPRVQVPSSQMDELLALAKANEGTLKIVKDGVFDLTTRMDKMEERQDEVEERLKKNSNRARTESQADLEQDAKIAAAAQRQLELEKNAESTVQRVTKIEGVVSRIEQEVTGNKAMMERVDKAVTGLLSNPKVKFLGAVIWMLITGYLAKRGLEVPR